MKPDRRPCTSRGASSPSPPTRWCCPTVTGRCWKWCITPGARQRPRWMRTGASLLRQYRYVAGGWLWELPAGKLEPSEPALLTAQRELIEEAGVSAREWLSLGTCLSSPGVFTETLHLFLATGIEPAAARHESAEVIEVHWVPIEAACAWALDGTITDGKTALGLLRARHIMARTPPGAAP